MAGWGARRRRVGTAFQCRGQEGPGVLPTAVGLGFPGHTERGMVDGWRAAVWVSAGCVGPAGTRVSERDCAHVADVAFPCWLLERSG